MCCLQPSQCSCGLVIAAGDIDPTPEKLSKNHTSPPTPLMQQNYHSKKIITAPHS